MKQQLRRVQAAKSYGRKKRAYSVAACELISKDLGVTQAVCASASSGDISGSVS
jgi:hypothetical protein